ncbi:kinase-like domain-containing protein [Aspergillus pseudocaelatus]|uniref:non-specific serine/threonine protein kinase n=1 Tax=Aspergillus pseudocaelatus TaxID=1825620 RepID=A0ABQ6WCE5_9EURO|nr:kinase-like domain-containing protein [Aspergillus pseudocaelatus]
MSLLCQNNLLYTQESLSRYRPGGYHPITLRDTFKNGRYKVYHRLAWGGFSTIWLAGDRELASNYIVQLLDSFTHEGPNGVHQCLVFELLDLSVDRVLADYRESLDKICPETVLRISRQLLKALEFIHSVGMCHGENELFEVLGTLEIEPLVRVDDAPLPGSFDYHVDLWRAGCMIYSFGFTTYPFWYLGEDEVLQPTWKPMQMRSNHNLKMGKGELSRHTLWTVFLMLFERLQAVQARAKIRRSAKFITRPPPSGYSRIDAIPTRCSLRITVDQALNVLSRTERQLEQ